MAAVNGINALAAAQGDALAGLPDVATTAPGAGRVRQWSEDLSRKARMQARAAVIMEAVHRLTVLVYETDPHGHRYNVDVDGRITCAYPMGRQGHTQFGNGAVRVGDPAPLADRARTPPGARPTFRRSTTTTATPGLVRQRSTTRRRPPPGAGWSATR